jgi:hypothetical protein
MRPSATRRRRRRPPRAAGSARIANRRSASVRHGVSVQERDRGRPGPDLAGAGILWGKSLVTAVSGLFKSQPAVVEAPKDPSTSLSKPKIPDRVGQPSSGQLAPVAQRVVLYDEDPSDPKGKQYVGSVIWRTEPIKASGNQKADIAVRADIEIPDRKFKMTMSFRRNTDSSLPASHTAELTFVLPQDFTGGGVGNVPGILMKSTSRRAARRCRRSPSRSPTASSWSACPTSIPSARATCSS